MNILFLDAYFEPESIAFTHLENDLLNALTKTGHNIYIICPTPTRGIDDTVRKEYKHRYKETLYKQNIIKKGADKNKVHVVPNWIDTCEVFPVSRNDNPIFDRYKLDRNKFYICYSGNIGHSQNMNLLLDVAKQIKDEEIRFVVIGDGAAKVEVEKRIEAEKITNVVMLPFQPYEEIANVFSVGDAGLIISKPGIGGSSVPSKTWSIMAAEKPILASFDQDSELAALIKKVGCGIVCPAGEKNSLIKAILKLKSENNTNMGIRGRHYVTNEISKKKCVDKYLKILKV